MTLDQAQSLIANLKPEKLLQLINSQPNPKPIVFFDIESAGEKHEDCIDPAKAKIVSLSVIKLHLDGKIELKHKIVNPGITMCDEVIAIHGITNEEAQKEPRFAAYAKGFASFISGCNFAGFNSNNFDKPILARELEEAGIDWVPLFENAAFVDVSNIYRHFNRRRLQDAVMRYLGEVMSDAHTSEYDSIKTLEVFEMMLHEHGNDMPTSLKDVELIMIENKPLDLFNKVYKDKEGVAKFNFGKHKGKSLESVLGPSGEDVNYYEWMTKQGFHKNTLKVVSDLRNSFRRPKQSGDPA